MTILQWLRGEFKLKTHRALVPVAVQKKENPTMALSEILRSCVEADDYESAQAIAAALNADGVMHQLQGGAAGHWTADRVMRFGRVLAEYHGFATGSVGLNAVRAAVRQAAE